MAVGEILSTERLLGGVDPVLADPFNRNNSYIDHIRHITSPGHPLTGRQAVGCAAVFVFNELECGRKYPHLTTPKEVKKLKHAIDLLSGGKPGLLREVVFEFSSQIAKGSRGDTKFLEEAEALKKLARQIPKKFPG